MSSIAGDEVEHIIVELSVKGFLDVEKISVPMDTSRAVGGVTASGGLDEADAKSSSYSFSVYKIEQDKAFLRLRVAVEFDSPVEESFSVSRGELSEYEFERGIKVKAYYERAGQPAQELVARVDEYINAKVKANQFGGSILIARDGKVLASRGYAMANIELDVPNTPQTKSRIGSLTKQFTALGIVMLQERGKLSIQDSVCKYVAPCPQVWQPITIHHLLTHTSGLPDVSTFPEFETIALSPLSTASLIERFKNKPLESKPGEKFRYNNGGYLLLGYIVERAAGESYEAFLQKNIFEPLGMSSSGVDHNELILKQRASGYHRQGNTAINAPYIYISNIEGGGSLYSTVEDMFLWSQVLNTEKLVSKKFLDVIFTPHAATPFNADYGYGWFIYKDKSGRQAYAHTGGINGFRSRIVRFPSEKVCVIVLSNVIVAPVNDIADDLAEMVFSQYGVSK